MNVITDIAFMTWCEKHGYDLDSAYFYAQTCYMGRTIRSRPGALFLFQNELIHHSYGWKDTWWAVFEPSVQVRLPVETISEIKRSQLSVIWSTMFMTPESAFTVTTTDARVDWLMLYRGGAEFERAWERLAAER